jgi:hypothetical protein
VGLTSHPITEGNENVSELKISEETMSRVLTQAILDGIGEDEKNNIIAQAVAYLTTPPKASYGVQPKTPLQSAFDSAMDHYVRTVVREYIERDETVKARVEQELNNLLGSLGKRLENDYELRNVVVEAIVDFFANR